MQRCDPGAVKAEPDREGARGGRGEPKSAKKPWDLQATAAPRGEDQQAK
jgi:hypothetical protein